MLISVVLETKSKLGSELSELNELLSVKGTHLNDALSVYQGNLYIVPRDLLRWSNMTKAEVEKVREEDKDYFLVANKCTDTLWIAKDNY